MTNPNLPVATHLIEKNANICEYHMYLHFLKCINLMENSNHINVNCHHCQFATEQTLQIQTCKEHRKYVARSKNIYSFQNPHE